MPAKLPRRPALGRCAGAGAVALALLGAGLPAAASGTVARPDLSRFYDQKVTWSRCTGDRMPKDLECGKVTVPLDYAKPGAGTLDVALARYRASGKPRGSVLLNFGGPGAPGISGLAHSGKDFMGLTNEYDVVTFDPRGVGRSSPVSCGADDTDGTAAQGELDVKDPRAALTWLRQEAAECTEHSGPVLAHMGTVDSARDMDVIRQALGDGKLDYLGFSYGTKLGAVYAAEFPGRVGRMALDGVDTLTESMAEQGVAGAQGQQTALEDFLDWCVTDVGCPFGQDRRQAGDRVVRLVRSLDANPVPGDLGGTFTGQDLVRAIGQALYSRSQWPTLERAVASLVDDGSTRGAEHLAYGTMARPRTSGTGSLTDAADIPSDNLMAALVAVNCADDPDRPTDTRITRDLRQLRARYQQASPVFGESRLTEVLMCYGRPKGTDYIRDEVKNLDTPKLLLVGTRGDPATPYRWTVETAARLGPSAVVLDNRGEGHTGYSSSKCVHRKVDDFLLYGSLPPSGSSCGADPSAGSTP
ncbi:alpha/beta fold hydrolase [Streptomyces sp. NPDC086787]|uniref:alpha/beta fold hydrolase n=1 Tax=Streptomyces sp. NPDC086787 TaxID=3365759 RepID=UPI003804AC0D